MCGIAGFWIPGWDVSDQQQVAERMAIRMIHRGPDGGGVWADPVLGIVMVHRRLAIIDLSEAGAQPMISSCGRFVISFNGEIYNFKEIRVDIEAARGGPVPFRGRSDTEVLLEAIRQWGVREALIRCDGMFAFALWDALEQRLVLARDRAGEKPLYYSPVRGGVLWASELSALREHPLHSREIDPGAARSMLTLGYIPHPSTIYFGTHSLPPAHFLEVRDPASSLPVPRRYWELGVFPRGGRGSPATFEDAVSEAEGLLDRAVVSRMVSDVPLGAFLSGGIDSSLVAASMAAQGGRVKTFTIGFREATHDESEIAAETALHIGSLHTRLETTEREAEEVVWKLPELLDQPLADPSFVPTYLLSKLTRQHVTVALSGDAGDELFGGYRRYREASAIARIFGSIPSGVGRFALSLASSPLAPPRFRRAGELIDLQSPDATYLAMISHWRGLEGGNSAMAAALHSAKGEGFLDRLMRSDFAVYLPGDILMKLDRASMAVSLESRVPMLSREMMEFAAAIPVQWKLDGRVGKKVLRAIAAKRLPRSLLSQPKRGFGIPVERWLRGGLRPWLDEALHSRRALSMGIIDRPELDAVISGFERRVSGRGQMLWDYAVLEHWLIRNSVI